jgi:hypothetical protein
MDTDLGAKLNELRRDFMEVQGRSFNHFFCPVLYTDEDVPLCKAHVVNKAFLNASRAWTVQRSDVDNFYGAHFESDFVLLQERQRHTPEEILVDPRLSRRFNPQILIDDEPVGHFLAPSPFPKAFTRFDVEAGERIVSFGLKLSPEQAAGAADKRWGIAVSKDVRVPALVSVLKAAHLTLFEMLGYRYTFTTPGHFIGRQLLGEFFLRNREETRSAVLEQAQPFFRGCAHMVRPTLSSQAYLGTVTDGKVLLCGQDDWVWALVVFIKAADGLNCALIPTLHNALAIDAFTHFIVSNDETLQVALCTYNRVKRHWEQAKSRTTVIWPKTGVLYS